MSEDKSTSDTTKSQRKNEPTIPSQDTFEEVVHAIMHAPQLPSQRAKKEAAKARREERKRQQQETQQQQADE